MNDALPPLSTARLHLRPFAIPDAPRVQQLAGAKEVYATTRNVPHPYRDGLAEQWIASLADEFRGGRGVTYAITLTDGAVLIGAIGLRITAEDRRGELGYWLGVPFWNAGYCTEAAAAIVRYGFESLGLHKITAGHMTNNPASGRVMVKAGLRKEGELVDQIYKDGAFHTISVYGLLKTEWRKAMSAGAP